MIRLADASLSIVPGPVFCLPSIFVGNHAMQRAADTPMISKNKSLLAFILCALDLWHCINDVAKIAACFSE